MNGVKKGNSRNLLSEGFKGKRKEWFAGRTEEELASRSLTRLVTFRKWAKQSVEMSMGGSFRALSDSKKMHPGIRGSRMSSW